MDYLPYVSRSSSYRLPTDQTNLSILPLLTGAMAEETVDAAIKEYGLKPDRKCITAKIQLVGSQGWNKMMFIKLIQQFGLEVSSRSCLSSASFFRQD